MKVYLIHNLDLLTKDQIIKNYNKNGYKEIWKNEDNNLLVLDEINIKDLDVYLKILKRFLNNNSMVKYSKGRIIDLTKAFQYASEKEKYNKFDNRYIWYIRNSILNEILEKND